MNTFPINNKKYKSEISRFRVDASIPTFEWGKKIYFLSDGKLKALIPIAVCACFLEGRLDEGILGDALVCKIAGEDGKRILWNCTSGKFFETPESYARHLSGVDSRMTVPKVYIRDILSVDHGLEVGGDYEYRYPMKWSWDRYNLKPEKCGTTIKALWIDEDGSHVELSMHHVYNLSIPVYNTPEECVLANTATVVDFDDEPEESEKKEFWVSLPDKVPVLARCEVEAKEIVRDAIELLVK